MCMKICINFLDKFAYYAHNQTELHINWISMENGVDKNFLTNNLIN